MKPQKTLLALLVLFALGTISQMNAQTSKLWGAEGELWNPASRLPDFDFFDQRAESRKPVEIPREDGSILVLDSD